MFILDTIKLNKKINTLENEIESLRDIIKNELYKEFIGKIKDYDELQILKKENKKLRSKNKYLKELLKEK